MSIDLIPLDKFGMIEAQHAVMINHYLHTPVDPRCSVEGYRVVSSLLLYNIGYLIFGRPEATRCADWYGSVEDAQAGRCEVTRWQVLNLARVYLNPLVQHGGKHCAPEYRLTGFTDRKGVWRSTLASTVLRLAVEQIGFDYLMYRPPCFLDEPYEIRWLLSYCDTSLHKGTIYREAGFELYRTNKRGIQTWRIRLPGLTPEQDRAVRRQSEISPRSNRYRAERRQMGLFGEQKT